MSDIESEVGYFSLMDLANADTTAIAPILSRIPSPGVYVVKGVSVEGKQGEPNEKGPGLISFNFVAEVLEARLVDKAKDPQKEVGRKLSESYTIWPDQVDELIGLLKGRYQKVGLDHSGRLGGLPGAEPGFLDRMVDHIFLLRVYTFKTKTGVERAGFDWIGVPEAGEAA